MWWLGRGLSRYIVRRYGTITLRKDIKERLRSIAKAEGISMAELIERMIEVYERFRGDGGG